MLRRFLANRSILPVALWTAVPTAFIGFDSHLKIALTIGSAILCLLAIVQMAARGVVAIRGRLR